MTFKITFQSTAKGKADTAIVPIYAGNKLGAPATALDRETGGLITHQLKSQKKFTGKRGQFLTLTAPKGADFVRILLVGVDQIKDFDGLAAETLGGQIFATLSSLGTAKAVLFADTLTPEQAASLATGASLRSYRFDKFRKSEKKPDIESLSIIIKSTTKAASAYKTLQAGVAGAFLARDLLNEPPNLLYPASFANIVKRDLTKHGVKVEIFDEKKLAALGFEAHLAVGQGSARPSRAVVLHWNGTRNKKSKPLAFVGKGVTFDTGGISIKPSAGMEDMKFDMGGAAAVAGLIKSLALRKAKVNVVGILGLAENMPSGSAYRPGDIIGSLSGKTIEVLNTDAEGRLVLADALTYIQRAYDPKFVINLATLTGAIVVALGGEYAGSFVNNDALWKNLESASKSSGEKLWRMPLDEAYRKAMDSQIADLRNTSTTGRDAGSCTAAGFLWNFIDKDRPWAHLDIAGVAWGSKDKPTAPKPAPGFGVRLLDRLVADHYESGT